LNDNKIDRVESNRGRVLLGAPAFVRHRGYVRKALIAAVGTVLVLPPGNYGHTGLARLEIQPHKRAMMRRLYQLGL
jgi:hypothetical protein